MVRRDLLPYLPLYRKVLLLDADMDTAPLNVSRLLRVWDCALLHPPLVVQPAVRGHIDFNFLSTPFWERYPNTLLHSSRYVEIQTPLLNSLFFEWLVRRVIQPMADLHLLYGSAWGYSTVWCRAAKAYSTSVLGWSHPKAPCAVLANTYVSSSFLTFLSITPNVPTASAGWTTWTAGRCARTTRS